MAKVNKVEGTEVKAPKAPKVKTEKAKVEKPVKEKEVKEKKTPEYGMQKTKDLPWTEKKVSVFKALKSLKAFDALSAKSATEIATKAGFKTPKDTLDTKSARHYCYHAVAGGLVAMSQVEGGKGYSFYLTKKGQAINPVKELKAGN